MVGYTDQNLLQNSALACFLVAKFVFRYEQLTAGTQSPELMKTLLILPILWHKSSCQIVRRKKINTTFRSVLVENGLLRSGMQDRIEAFAPATLQGINFACATGLLVRKYDENRPMITIGVDRWPKGSNPMRAPDEMLQAIERLAFWFRDYSAAELFAQILKD